MNKNHLIISFSNKFNMQASLIVLAICLFLQIPYSSIAQNTNNIGDPAKSIKKQLENGQAEISFYNSACYFALHGESTLAFKYLQSAVEIDKINTTETLLNDRDLASLHNDPQWQRIVEGVRANKENQKKTDSLFFNQQKFWESGTFNTPYQENLSSEEKIAGLSRFWSEVKYNFVNFDLIPDLNFDSLYFAYIPKVVETKSTKEYYQTLSSFCSYLKDGHTNIYVPKELEEDTYSRPLLRTRLIEDKVLIISIHDPSLEEKGIKVGQEVLKVDGIPVLEYAQQFVTPYQSASTPQDQNVRSFDYSLFAGSPKKTINLVLQDDKGTLNNVTISRVSPMDRNEKMKVPNFEYKILEGDIAYVILNSFGSDVALKEFEKHYDEIAQSKAIIFDVRANGGGNSSYGWKILEHIVNKPVKVHTMYTRLYNPTFRAWNKKQQLYSTSSSLRPRLKQEYSNPVIVLTSARSYSAAEDFVGAFKSMNRGLIIGEPTGGSSGQPLAITLPGKGSARICTKRDMLGNGNDFIGKGILPDIVISPSVDDIRQGKDPVLETAINKLKERL